MMNYPVTWDYRISLRRCEHVLSLSRLLCLKRNCCKSCHCSFPTHFPLCRYIWHTVTRASWHHSWIYVYAQGYICIVALFLSIVAPSLLSVIDSCTALILSGITVAVLPLGKNQPSHCQRSRQYLCWERAFFRMQWLIARQSCLPFGESSLTLWMSGHCGWR